MSAGDLFSRSRRLVIKIGSALLVDKRGYLSHSRIRGLVEFVIRLREEGKEVVVVSSGAVAASHRIIPPSSKSGQKPSLPEKQARSAIGQVYLMEQYRRTFARKGYRVGQILISKFSINHRGSYLNARNTIHQLWEMGAIPVINENDPLATEEFRFGENDILGALTCGLVDADLYLILSYVDGVYHDFTAKGGKDLYTVINSLSPQFLSRFVEKTNSTKTTSAYGSGGILAKLEAARMAAKFGVPTLIKNGSRKNLYEHILDDGRGTLIQIFDSQDKSINAKKRWLLSHGSPRGSIGIDAGAVTAIFKGKSLLPGGVTSVEGAWEEGDICDVIDSQGKIIARGLCNYSHRDLALIQGKRSTALSGILGRPSHAEVIHRDNMVLWEKKK